MAAPALHAPHSTDDPEDLQGWHQKQTTQRPGDNEALAGRVGRSASKQDGRTNSCFRQRSLRHREVIGIQQKDEARFLSRRNCHVGEVRTKDTASVDSPDFVTGTSFNVSANTADAFSAYQQITSSRGKCNGTITIAFSTRGASVFAVFGAVAHSSD